MQVKVPIEIDIAHVNDRWVTKRQQNTENHYVIGFFQRDGQAIIDVLEDKKPQTIHDAVMNRLPTQGSIIYAPANVLPVSLFDFFEIHELDGGRAKVDKHINNLNNLWGALKRSIKREYVQVSKKHLQLYCDEVAWQANNRHLTPMEKFELLLSNCATKKPNRYKDLTAK